MNRLRMLGLAALASVALTGTAAQAEAQTESDLVVSGPRGARRVTLEEALALFARDNLELRLARSATAEAVGAARQAAAFPNPSVTGSYEPLSADDVDYSESYLNIGQRLEWPGTRSARREQAERGAAAARARFAGDSARIAFQVKRAYVEAVRAESQQNVLERVVEVFRAAEKSAQERLREGDISLYASRRISVERARYETALAEAALDAGSARRALALLVAPESADLELAPAALDLGTPPALEGERLMAGAVARSPDIAGAQAELDAVRSAARVTRGERIPDLTATGGFKRQSDGFSGAFLSLSLPVPLWDRRGGAIDASDARVAAAAARLALTRRLVENDVRRAQETYLSLAFRARLLADPISMEAADLLEIAQVAYDAGEMELIELLDAAQALHQARTLEARLEADLWTSWFDLERAVGGFAPGEPTEETEGWR